MRKVIPALPTHRKQRGLAMVVLITLIVLVGAYLIASRLTRTSAELAADRDQRTLAALREAKAALIAYASDPNLTQIGSLPCPDRKLPSDVNAGTGESSCATNAVRIGRLPWKTINVSSDLRDGSGEPLWYVLSGNFRKLSGTTIINSDTPGQITVTGSAPASNIVALIIAPGLALQNQNRDKTNLALLNDPSNYLEGTNSGANDNAFETNAPPNDKDASGGLVFNDRMVAITHADLFATVEPVVVGKLKATLSVRDAIEVYRATWGRYPFPAAFSNPGTSTFKGTVGAAEGLLPLTTDSAFITWKTSSPAPSISAAPGNPGTVDVGQWYTNCSASSSTELQCKADWCGSTPNLATVRITATANNAGLAFVRSLVDSDLTVDRSAFGYNANWTSSSGTIVSGTYALASNGTGTVSVVIQLPDRSCGSPRTAWIRIPVLPYHSITETADPDTGWFVSNRWHRVTYYAVSPNYLPGGTPPCIAGSTCLTIDGLPSAEYPNSNDKNALLILMGRSLNGSARPSGTLSNYLEGQNASTGDRVFANRVGAPANDNDRVVVLSP